MKNSVVSVGILSYNRPKLLARAIQSITLQTYKNLDIHISDNASTSEGIKEILHKYQTQDPRIRITQHEQNIGAFANFRYVLAQAQGDYFMFLADDDYYHAAFIENCLASFLQYPTTVLASCMPQYATLNEIKSEKIKYIPHTIGLSNFEKYKLLIQHTFADSNLFLFAVIKTHALKKSMAFLHHYYSADTLLLTQLLPFGDIVINQNELGIVSTVHETQMSISPLRYKTMSKQGSNFTDRIFFFTKILVSYCRIVFTSKLLTTSQKIKCCLLYFKMYVKHKRHHLIKYDLGIHNFVHYFTGKKTYG